MESSVELAVVVLDWDGGDETLRCLESVAASSGLRPRMILVDNASASPVIDQAQRRIPGLEVYRNSANLGYSGGNNIGLRAALDAGAEYVLVLNNDARVFPETLREMVEVARADDAIGAVGARVLLEEEPSRLWMAWGEVTFGQSLVRLAGRGDRDAVGYRRQRDVAWVSGCAILMTRRALERVGLFDEAYFAYHEEVDWCARVREAGMRVVYAGEAAVVHRGEGSSGEGDYVSRKQYFASRNAVRFVRRHGSLSQRIRFFLLLGLTLPLQYAKRVLLGEGHGVVLKARGLVDALLDRPLPRSALGLDR